MKSSTDRILTTHAGRLEGPPEIGAMWQATRANANTPPSDAGGIDAAIRRGMVDVVRKQAASGIDVISDGEVGKLGFGLAYYGKRFSGLESRQVKPGEPGWMSMRTGERLEFPEFYATLPWPTPSERVVVTGAITYIGQQEVQRDIELFRASLAAAGVTPEETFMCVLAPGWLEHFFYNEHYSNDEDYLFALADAIKHEYKAVVEAGFVLQIDDPALPDTYDMIVPAPSIDEYRKFAEVRIEAVNRALEGIPQDRVRYHICWGSWHGPHTHDLPLEHVLDLMLRVRAGAYSIEAANPRHEHEWKLWTRTPLPPDKLLIPGVVSHATNIIEHPEIVADRIVRFANIVGRERVIAGTDCGLGFRVHPQIAWAKLKTLAEGAALASRQLWGRS
jgi:5-methyltetrahydropteroyltriglutamate--homocysteine methyltransferase